MKATQNGEREGEITDREDVYQWARERVTAREAAERYGLTPNRAGFIRCPFHGEKTPSLKLYPGTGGYHCFGCGAGGDVIDFTARLFGLDRPAALRRLNEDFSLTIPLDRPPSREEQAAAKRRRALSRTRSDFGQWRQETLKALCACVRVGNQARAGSWEELSDRQALALRERASLEHLADTLLSGTLEEQIYIFRERKYLKNLWEKILNCTPTK